jgi:hypothetical protein
MSLPRLTKFMGYHTLIDLPTEILRKICGILPCCSALDFPLVCRITYRACDDWTVWIAVLIHSGNFPNGLPDTKDRGAWKSYTIAARRAMASYEHWTTRDFEGYMPQLFSLCHTRLLQSNGLHLEHIYNSTIAKATLAHNGETVHARATGRVGTYTLSIRQQAQAVAFCTAVHYFGFPADYSMAPNSHRRLTRLNDTGSCYSTAHSGQPSCYPFSCTSLHCPR